VVVAEGVARRADAEMARRAKKTVSESSRGGGEKSRCGGWREEPKAVGNGGDGIETARRAKSKNAGVGKAMRAVACGSMR
jgi:hypothetical protein